MDWIALAQERDRWRALVNTIMKLWVPQSAGSDDLFSLSGRILLFGDNFSYSAGYLTTLAND